jgi:hypothetical protein
LDEAVRVVRADLTLRTFAVINVATPPMEEDAAAISTAVPRQKGHMI